MAANTDGPLLALTDFSLVETSALFQSIALVVSKKMMHLNDNFIRHDVS